MKKNYFLVLMIVSVFCVNAAFAQLTTRINDTSIVRLGGRPMAGDMALTLSYPVMTDTTFGIKLKNSFLQYNDYFNFQYYHSNTVVYTLGLRFYKSRSHSAGTTIDTAKFDVSTNDYLQSKRQYCIIPGIEKHFSPKNIFDVYVGGNLLLGFGRNIADSNTVLVNGDYDKYTSNKNVTIVGLGGVVGFNIFVANLPISIGVRYDVNTDWTFGGKTKIEHSTYNGKTKTSQTYYMEDNDAFGTPDYLQYSKLSKSEWGTDQEIRIVLNIYFDK